MKYKNSYQSFKKIKIKIKSRTVKKIKNFYKSEQKKYKFSLFYKANLEF